MRDFPSCFGENGVQIADSSSPYSSRTFQNLVSCVYQCRFSGISCLITVTWTKNLMGQGLTIGIDDSSNQSLCKVDLKPWLFSKRKGSKNLEIDSSLIDIYWDLSSAKFGSGPEPIEGFYLAIVCNREIALLLGDLRKEAYKRIEANPNPISKNPKSIFIAKRENIFGKKLYGAKAQFFDKGKIHDVIIECDAASGGTGTSTGTGINNDPSLVIRVDGKAVMQVKRLRWKFRGNHTILVDGIPVEVFWDVHNWLFGNLVGDAVFMFQTCCEKFWSSQSLSDPSLSSWSCSEKFGETQLQGLGFSLMLCAWKNE